MHLSRRRPGMTRPLSVLTVLLVCGISALLSAIVTAAPAYANDSPTYYWYGADGFGPVASGSGPYTMPTVGGTFGVYAAEVGTWEDMQGCGSYSGRAINGTDVTAANWEFTNQYGQGHWPEGTALYWYMAGPGADPKYNPSTYTTALGNAWGVAQATAAMNEQAAAGPAFDSGVVFMDIENGFTISGSNYYNGWNEWVNGSGSSCGLLHSGNPGSIPEAFDRAVMNGFMSYITGQTLTPGLYTSPDYWTQTMGTCSGTNSNACMKYTYQWTAEGDSGCVQPNPVGWSQAAGPCSATAAAWFAGVTSSYEAAWQWCEASSIDNYCNLGNGQPADYDQSYAVNWPLG